MSTEIPKKVQLPRNVVVIYYPDASCEKCEERVLVSCVVKRQGDFKEEGQSLAEKADLRRVGQGTKATVQGGIASSFA